MPRAAPSSEKHVNDSDSKPLAVMAQGGGGMFIILSVGFSGKVSRKAGHRKELCLLAMEAKFNFRGAPLRF